MIGLGLGAISFFIVIWVDVAAIKKINWLKPLLWITSITVFLLAVDSALSDSVRYAAAPTVHIAGWALVALSLVLLCYSLFFEIPFLAAYVRTGQPARVVSRGTYALCRHPGVLWFAGVMAGLLLAHPTRSLLFCAPIWLGLDTLYAYLQERLFFVRMFGTEYVSYQRSVPMLIPTLTSVRECLRTLPGRDIGSSAG